MKGSQQFPIIIVDDDTEILKTTERILRFEGFSNIITMQDGRELIPLLKQKTASLIILDLMMPYIYGEDILKEVHEYFPEIPVIVCTGANEIEQAVRCMKEGAFDYVPKNADPSHFLATVHHALTLWELRIEYNTVRNSLISQIPISEAFSKIITRNQRMLDIFRYAEAIAETVKPILITGESGSGKELIAESIHLLSGRKGKLVCVNVAGLDDNLFADTLFGHVKGAFTSADTSRQGFIEQANGGTLFLDEIGDLDLQSQIKLLRLIEERRYYPVGSDLQKNADILLITATNKNLREMSHLNKFRADLFFRLETHHISLPPLRERKDDLALLIEHFIDKASTQMQKTPPLVPEELACMLSTYNYPGNIRELESMIYDAVSRCKSHILALDSFKEKIFKDKKNCEGFNYTHDYTLKSVLEECEDLPTIKSLEELLIAEAMTRANQNQGIAARILGINRTTLNKHLMRFKNQ